MRSPCESMSSLLAANGAGRESELETVEPKMPENQTGFPDYDSLPTVCANSAPPRPARVNRSVNGTVDAQTVQPSIRPTSTELFDQPTQTPSLPLHRTPPQAPSSPPYFTPLVPQTHPPDLSTLLGFCGASSPPAPARPVGFEETESDYETVAQSSPGAKKKKSQTHISLSRVQSMDPPDTESLAGVEVSIPEPKPQPLETFDQSSRLPSPPSHRTPPQFPSSPPNFTPILPQKPPPDLPNLFGRGDSGFPSPPVRPGGFKETESDYETVAQSSPGAKKKKSQSQISLSMAQSMDPPGAGAGGLAAVEVSMPEPKTQPLGPSIRPTSTEFFDKPTGIPSLPLHRTPPQVPSSPPNFTPMLPQIPPPDILTHLGLGGAVFSSHPVRSGGLKETESDYETVAQSSPGAKKKKSQSRISLSMAQSINPPVAEGAAVSISDLKLEPLGPPSAHPASPTITTPNENFDQPTTTSMHRLAPQIPSSPPNFTPVLPQTPPPDLASTLGSGRGILSPPVQSEGAQEPGSEYDFVTQTGPGAKKESHPQNPSLVSPSIDPPGTNMPVNKPPSVGPKEQNSLVHEFSPMTTTGTNKDTGATAECRADTEIAIGWGSNKDADRRKPSNTCLQISGISKIITKIRKATSRTSVPALPDLSKLSGNSEDAEKGANSASRGNEGVSSPTSPRGPVSSRSASHTDSFSVGYSGGRSTQGGSEGMGGLHGKEGPGTSRFTSNTVLPQVHFSSSIRTPPVENSSPPTAKRKSPSASSLGGSLGASKLMAHLTFLESETDAGQGVSGDMKKLKATVSIAMHPRKSYATEQKESIIVPTQRSSAPNLSIHGVDTRPAVVLDGEENTQESIPIPEKPTSSGGISGREQQESPWSPPIPDKLTTSMISCLVMDTRCYEEEAEDWGGPISPASANLPNSSQTCADAKSPSPPPTVKGPPTPPTPRGSCASSPPIPAKSMGSGISVHANSRQEGEPMDTKRFLAHANPLTIPETPPPLMHRPPPVALPFEKDEEDYDIPGSQISMATPVPPSRPPLSAQTSTTRLPIEQDEKGYAIPDKEISKTPLATAPSRPIQPPPTPTFGALRVEKDDDDYTIPGDENGKFQPPLFKPPPVPHPQANLPIAQDDEEYTIPGYHIDAPLAPSRPPPSPFTNPPAAGEIATDEDEYAIPSDNPPSFPTTSPSPLRPPPTPCRPTPTPTLTQAASAQTRAGFEQVLDEEEYDIPSPTLPPSVDTRLFWQGGESGQSSATSLSGSSASTVSIQSQVPNRPPPIPNLPSGTQHGCEVELEKDEDGYAIPSSVADSSLSVICVRASTPPLAGCPSARGDNFGVLPNGAKGWQVSNPPTQPSNSPRICRPIGPSGSAGSSNIDNKPPQMDSVSGPFSAARMSPPLPARTSRGFGPMGYHHPPLSRLPSSSPNTTIPPIKPPRRREEAPPTPTTTTTQSAPSSPAASPDLPPRTAGCVLIGGKQRDMSPIGKKPSGDLILKKAAVEAEVNRPAVKMVVSAFEQLAELESTDLGARRNSGNSGNGKMRSRGSSIQSYSADFLPTTIRSKLDDDRGAQRKFSAGANGTRPRQQSAGRDGPMENSVSENVRGSRSENSNLNGGGGDPDFEFLLALGVRVKGFGVEEFESTAGQLKQGVQEEDEYDVLTNISAK